MCFSINMFFRCPCIIFVSHQGTKEIVHNISRLYTHPIYTVVLDHTHIHSLSTLDTESFRRTARCRRTVACRTGRGWSRRRSPGGCGAISWSFSTIAERKERKVNMERRKSVLFVSVNPIFFRYCECSIVPGVTPGEQTPAFQWSTTKQRKKRKGFSKF